MITKKDCESRITLLMMEIADTLREFDPKAESYTAFWTGKNLMFFNDYEQGNDKRVCLMVAYKGGKE